MARQKVKELQGGGAYAPYTPPKRKAKIVEAEQLEMKGTPGPYNPRRVRPKKRTPTTTNLEKLRARATETGPGTRLYSAVKTGAERAEEERKRKKEKEKGRATRKKEVKETPFGLRTVRGRAMLSDAAKEQLAKRKAARQKRIKEAVIREAARKRERAPVTTRSLAPIKSLAVDKTVYPLPPDLEELLVEKTGGKVSRKKGGTVSRTEGGKVWNGNEAVAEGYDTV